MTKALKLPAVISLTACNELASLGTRSTEPPNVEMHSIASLSRMRSQALSLSIRLLRRIRPVARNLREQFEMVVQRIATIKILIRCSWRLAQVQRQTSVARPIQILAETCIETRRAAASAKGKPSKRLAQAQLVATKITVAVS